MTRPPTNVDAAFDDVEPTPVPAMPSRAFEPDPPELRARQVSAMGGETSDDALLPEQFRQFRQEMRDTLRPLVENVKLLTERVLPLLADHSKRLLDGERRQDRTDQRVDTLLRDIADHTARLSKLEQAATRRAKRK